MDRRRFLAFTGLASLVPAARKRPPGRPPPSTTTTATTTTTEAPVPTFTTAPTTTIVRPPQVTTNLPAALAAAQPGSVIYFTGDQPACATSVAGTQAAPIRVIGVGQARIVGAGISVGVGLRVTHDWYAFSDFTVTTAGQAVWVEGASHGRLDRITGKNTGGECFKFRRNSTYWYVADCIAQDNGQEGTFGEGFYCGDASQNWLNLSTPDTTSYITFERCRVLGGGPVPPGVSDGFDLKEGSHHIKVKSCDVDRSVSPPPSGQVLGDSGVFTRCNDVQIIDTLVHGNTQTGSGFYQQDTTVNSIHYGERVEIKHGQTASEAGYFHNLMAGALNIKVYDDYVNGSASGLKTGAGTPTYPAANTFSEFSFDDTQWPAAA